MFNEILCNAKLMNGFTDMKEDVFVCFSKLFIIINEREGNLERNNINTKVAKFEGLLGKETLWSIFVHVNEEKV